jgi:hypothetical protein
VNYDRSQHFKSRDPFDICIQSRNFLIDYDADFNLLSQKEIIENFSSQQAKQQDEYGCLVRGLEPDLVHTNVTVLDSKIELV